jgi:hypothetical protein
MFEHSFIFNDGFGDLDTYTLEITQGNQVQRQQMQMPAEIVKIQFLQIMEQAAHAGSPIKVKISKVAEEYCEQEKRMIRIPKSIEFANKFCQEYREGGSN